MGAWSVELGSSLKEENQGVKEFNYSMRQKFYFFLPLVNNLVSLLGFSFLKVGVGVSVSFIVVKCT
jgi:hypothetical protein